MFFSSGMNYYNPKPFVYPYSKDPFEKRAQIWANLAKGILLENSQTFISWDRAFYQLNAFFSEQTSELGDRTVWQLGKRTILDGYRGRFGSYEVGFLYPLLSLLDGYRETWGTMKKVSRNLIISKNTSLSIYWVKRVKQIWKSLDTLILERLHGKKNRS